MVVFANFVLRLQEHFTFCTNKCGWLWKRFHSLFLLVWTFQLREDNNWSFTIRYFDGSHHNLMVHKRNNPVINRKVGVCQFSVRSRLWQLTFFVTCLCSASSQVLWSLTTSELPPIALGYKLFATTQSILNNGCLSQKTTRNRVLITDVSCPCPLARNYVLASIGH